jgi:amidase
MTNVDMLDLLASASALRALLRSRRISSAELVEATVERIEALNPTLNAVVARDVRAARQAAFASDARLAGGEPRPLEGLPITIKDAYDVAGLVSTGGVPAYRERIPGNDASAVARLRNAGAIVLGKSNVPVFSADFQTTNPIYGTTCHPDRPTHSPGGSSGGAAVAVATGMSAFELGSDLAGSIRWPVHACGVFGLKTTWNLVSTFGHVPPPPERRMWRNPELLVAGPITRSAADLALLLEVIAGPRDAMQPGPTLRSPRRRTPEGLRIALWLDEPLAPTEKAVAAAVRQAARLLAAEGAIVDDTARPGFTFAEAYEIFAVLNHAIVAYGLPAKVRDRLAARASARPKGDLSHEALQARGARLSPGDYNDLTARRGHLRRKWARFFERFDVVLCPPAPVGAIIHDQTADVHARELDLDGTAVPYLDFLKWAALATGANLPAAVAPVLRAADGLPRGVQIVAAEGEDLTAVAVAGMIEAITGKRPNG